MNTEVAIELKETFSKIMDNIITTVSNYLIKISNKEIANMGIEL